jgi:ADP-heptose:LPS heptosyltransferase
MEQPNRILLIHLFSNGDCLYATTIAKQIKHDFAGCKLIWAISSHCKNIILNNPYVDEVWDVPIPHSSQNEQVFADVISNARQKKQNGELDKIFITQILGNNFSKYDGCVRSSIYRCYGKPLTVNKTPILILKEQEIERAKNFAAVNKLSEFKNIILFECAPQSGQVKFDEVFIKNLSSEITNIESTCIVLSSAKKIDIEVQNVFDGSVLTIRETAALSHYCSLLIGCSSGITWVTYSTAAKQLPTVQLLNKDTYIYNPPSVAFERIGEPNHLIIELFEFDLKSVSSCVNTIIKENFDTAKQLYNQPAKKQFKIYRGITHRFLSEGKIKLLSNFIKLNIAEHGSNFIMLFKIFQGFILFPLQLIVNRINKK